MSNERLEGLLGEQLAYYRARAPEYDAVFEQARELGPDGPIAERVRALAAGRDVLELACGTGHWSAIMAEVAASLTAIDAAPEMLAEHARTVQRPVRRICADVLAWEPDRRYEVVFFGFWLSHVPDERWEAFWSVVARALAPGGVAAFSDSAPAEAALERRLAPGTVRRSLEDGREYRIVKVFRSAAALQAALERLGWRADVEQVTKSTLYGTATLTRGSP